MIQKLIDHYRKRLEFTGNGWKISSPYGGCPYRDQRARPRSEGVREDRRQSEKWQTRSAAPDTKGGPRRVESLAGEGWEKTSRSERGFWRAIVAMNHTNHEPCIQRAQWHDSRPFPEQYSVAMTSYLERTPMQIPLAQEARYSSRSYNVHRMKNRRRPDGARLPEGVNDVESPETCWERAGERSRAVDPTNEKALTAFRRYRASRSNT
jgi:hypothetical protein